MTATDELRRLLDERGVEYDTHGERYGTWYDTPLGGHVYVPENNAGWLHVRSDAMTPEQAIAATLGNDGVGRTNDGVAELEAENAKLRELMRDMFDGMCMRGPGCRDCEHYELREGQRFVGECEYHKRMRELGVVK